MKTYFYSLADYITEQLKPGEVHLLSFSSEQSDFSRLNRCKIRQAGHVAQHYLNITLINGCKSASHELVISVDPAADRELISSLLNALRDRLAVLPEDPYLLYSDQIHSFEVCEENHLASNEQVMDDITNIAKDKDLVGIYASGAIRKGFANSLGQRNWFQTYSFSVDWSLYHKEDKAVTQTYAGLEWDRTQFESKIETGQKELEILSRAPKVITPGKYRAYIAPAAFKEFIDMLNWGGFGLKSHKTKDSPLMKMIEGGQKLDGSVFMLENTKDGIAPGFDEFGFVKPDRVSMITAGAFDHPLVSARSAKEFHVETNGANADEVTDSFEMLPGTVDAEDVLCTLDTGVYMNNAWYLNFSDRNACRITGMTRFACFWVENGQIKAPLSVMRFDDTIYRMLGENLVGLTRERDFMVSSDTYYQRSTRSAHLPGMIVKDFAFTL
jgi:predicted Zn-dependent protease